MAPSFFHRLPGKLYLPTRLHPVTRGIDDHVGQLYLLDLRWLRVYPLLSILEAEPSVRHQPFDLLLGRAGRHP